MTKKHMTYYTKSLFIYQKIVQNAKAAAHSLSTP